MKKSYAQILQENLTDKSFRNKPPDTQIFALDTFDFYKQDLYRHFINLRDLSKVNTSRIFYANLFKSLKLCFYWCEEGWQGSVFAVYEYNNKFISIKSGFDSYENCYGLPDSQDKLDKVFSNLSVSDSINEINIHGNNSKYTHPELITKFKIWTKKYKLENIKENTEDLIDISWAQVLYKKK